MQALADVSLDFVEGEIHAVLGENGAGKSTLMHILAGAMRPDSGSIEIRDPGARIGMVHQHFMLVPAFSVEENLLLASRSAAFVLQPTDELASARAWAQRLGWKLDLSARTASLPVGELQRIEILKALATDAPVLIFDEPTAVLSPEEVDELFGVLRQLRDAGKAVLLIAHKLAEVLSVADRISVLRRGRLVASGAADETDAETLARHMVGELPAGLSGRPEPAASIAFSASGMSVRGERGNLAIDNATFAIRAGEIFGIGGVDGNGQIELAEAVAGLRRFEGELRFEREGSVVYIPQDRQRDGLALGMSVGDNFLIAGHRLPELQKGGWLNLRAARDWAQARVDQYAIRLGSLDDPIRSLSGGNQQKVIVARELGHDTALIVAVNPTRGLDIAATRAVHAQLQERASLGVPILLISTDLDELAALADRTQFLVGGRLVSDRTAAAMVGG